MSVQKGSTATYAFVIMMILLAAVSWNWGFLEGFASSQQGTNLVIDFQGWLLIIFLVIFVMLFFYAAFKGMKTGGRRIYSQ